MTFGQLVIGPPGAGKTTYCNGMHHFFSLQGRRVAVINLDPANEQVPYECAVDIKDLISLEEVMESLKLGPNGGLVYCMDFIQKNLDWLQEKLAPLEDQYLIFDLPGQVELFMMHDALKEIVSLMSEKWGYRLTVIHLVDSHLCTDPSKYISALMLSLGTMLHMGLPHINVLSKIDLIERYGNLDFNLDFYTDVLDLEYLQNHLEQDPLSRRFKKLTEGLCDIVEDFSLVNFTTLNIEDKESVQKLVALVDKSNGRRVVHSFQLCCRQCTV
ncbi:GPN-loop GTPase qqt1 [Cymbomonas tetramitiformis]|uniref:GPN-loop GTPase 2 n=1 Tax=Cymbomonas tetramitiformis TaxID=36881 RepID=A0AAE0FBT5_9CHLO|nr:GPN-loop GTPase qqt1 [Cymbomonas tetramitiformis]